MALKNRCRPSPISLTPARRCWRSCCPRGNSIACSGKRSGFPARGRRPSAGHYLKGQALFAWANFPAALAELLAASKIIDTDVNLLNLIGRSFLKIGDPEQAAQAFSASLALNQNQPEIEKLLAEAEAKTHDKGK